MRDGENSARLPTSIDSVLLTESPPPTSLFFSLYAVTRERGGALRERGSETWSILLRCETSLRRSGRDRGERRIQMTKCCAIERNREPRVDRSRGNVRTVDHHRRGRLRASTERTRAWLVHTTASASPLEIVILLECVYASEDMCRVQLQRNLSNKIKCRLIIWLLRVKLYFRNEVTHWHFGKMRASTDFDGENKRGSFRFAQLSRFGKHYFPDFERWSKGVTDVTAWGKKF